MSAIGGIVNLKNDEVDFEALNSMRLSMSLRGRKRSSAFLCGGAAMFFNSSSLDAFEEGEDIQPKVCERWGYANALCIDGEGFSSSAVLERYFVKGVDFLGALDGAFSLAIYDGERDTISLGNFNPLKSAQKDDRRSLRAYPLAHVRYGL